MAFSDGFPNSVLVTTSLMESNHFQIVMKIQKPSQKLLFCTVPLEMQDVNENLLGSGTSFVVSHYFPDHGEELFAVTNKHVVAGAWNGYFFFTRDAGGLPQIGSPIVIRMDAFEPQFHGHPDEGVDICVLPLCWQIDMIPTKPFLNPISTETFPTQEFIDSSDAVLPVLFVGYPNGLFDQSNYTPIVRTGMTATPVQLDFDGKRAFLIDASVFPGSSGSPVFAYSNAWDGGIAEAKFLGIVTSVMVQQDVGKFEAIPAPTQDHGFVEYQHMIDLGVVVKSELVVETIEDFWVHHEHQAREYRKARQG